jgi:hypothetical protein
LSSPSSSGNSPYHWDKVIICFSVAIGGLHWALKNPTDSVGSSISKRAIGPWSFQNLLTMAWASIVSLGKLMRKPDQLGEIKSKTLGRSTPVLHPHSPRVALGGTVTTIFSFFDNNGPDFHFSMISKRKQGAIACCNIFQLVWFALSTPGSSLSCWSASYPQGEKHPCLH